MFRSLTLTRVFRSLTRVFRYIPVALLNLSRRAFAGLALELLGMLAAFRITHSQSSILRAISYDTVQHLSALLAGVLCQPVMDEATSLVRLDETRSPHNLQMLGDRTLRHLKPRGERSDAKRFLTQLLQNADAGLRCECAEHFDRFFYAFL